MRTTKAQAVSRLLDTSTFTESTNTTVHVHKPKFTVLRQATLCAEMGPEGEAVWVSRASTNYETRSVRKDQQRRDQQNEPIRGDRDTVHSPTPNATHYTPPFKMQHRDPEQQGKIFRIQRSAKNWWPQAARGQAAERTARPNSKGQKLGAKFISRHFTGASFFTKFRGSFSQCPSVLKGNIKLCWTHEFDETKQKCH